MLIRIWSVWLIEYGWWYVVSKMRLEKIMTSVGPLSLPSSRFTPSLFPTSPSPLSHHSCEGSHVINRSHLSRNQSLLWVSSETDPPGPVETQWLLPFLVPGLLPHERPWAQITSKLPNSWLTENGKLKKEMFAITNFLSYYIWSHLLCINRYIIL